MLILDENITDANAIIRSHQEKVGAVLALKLCRFGGLTRTRQVWFLLNLFHDILS